MLIIKKFKKKLKQKGRLMFWFMFNEINFQEEQRE